jgi:hypothetical protein
MSYRLVVPPDILAKLQSVCLGLPDVYEERAWVGTRWCVRKKNFAHVLMIDRGWPPAYAHAAGCEGPACALTFRLAARKLRAPRFTRAPFFRPVWFANIAGLLIDRDTDWDEVEALLTQSYRVLAPKNLAALVEGVPDTHHPGYKSRSTGG